MVDELISELVDKLGYYGAHNLKDAISALAFIILGFLSCMLLFSSTVRHLRYNDKMETFFMLKIQDQTGKLILVLNTKNIDNFRTVLYTFCLTVITVLHSGRKYDYKLFKEEDILKKAKILTWFVVCTAIIVMVIGITLTFSVIVPAETIPTKSYKLDVRFFN